MALNISRGKLSRPQKVVIYAPEGLGKTTLASHLPSPIFFDFERGTDHLDVARLNPETLAEFEKWARELIKDPQGFKTVIIDTVDWMEETVVNAVVAGANDEAIKNIEDFGWGKGWNQVTVRMNGVLSIFDRLIDAGLHVVCLAHCAVRQFDDPKLAGGYHRYELKMYKDRPNSKGTASLLKEWADALLFGTFEDKVKMVGPTGERARAVAASGRDRVLMCSHSAAWDAKNRHGLRDKEQWSVETLMKVLGNPITGESGGDPVTGEESPGDAVVFVTPLPTSDDPIEGIEEHEEPDEELDRMLSPHAQEVNLFLRDKEKVGPYQSYRSMPTAYRAQVLSNPSGFLARVKAYSAERSAA